MFGRRQQPEIRAHVADSMISAGTQLEGRFEAEGTVAIDGRVKGSIVVEGNLLIGAGAEIEADVQAANIEVAGVIRGNVVARETLSLLPGSRLEGDVYTQCFRIEDGAVFKGNCHMGETRVDEALGNGRGEGMR